MKIRKAFCLFEQSGTWKNEFKKLGIDAEDYDILDDFGETDHRVDLFAEINKAYNREPSLFDQVGPEDIVIAFFPCTRFEAKIALMYRGEAHQQRNYTDEKKLAVSMTLHDELHYLYTLCCKLFTVSIWGGWRLIVENPYTQPHYLTLYFPIKPSVIDKDRTENGDYFKKPTQFWFVNCTPEQNMFFEPIDEHPVVTIDSCVNLDGDQTRKVKRSLMHPQYARRFIKMYLTEGA